VTKRAEFEGRGGIGGGRVREIRKKRRGREIVRRKRRA
jgi:hypothetical protein